MKVRACGACIAGAGAATIAWWALSGGGGPELVSSMKLPLAAFWLLLLGFFVWMAGMVRVERSSRQAWGGLESRIAPGGYFDTAVFARIRMKAAPQAPRPARPHAPVPRPPAFDERPITVAATGRPSAASPVALAVLDTIELKRLSTGDTPLPLPPEERILPRPATAAARARF